tara:strand:+ start:860 stop:1558 length:699 start_codon:yes stop_codon:yes gene_type:complete
VPIVLDTAGDPLLPNPNYGGGHVSAQNHVTAGQIEEPPLQHRPHAFALKHGDGGAKIAYGQLFWRIDHLDFQFETGSTSAGGTVTYGDCLGAGQPRAIKGFDVTVPRVDSSSGALMSAAVDGVAGDGIPNVYHQLDAFGTVYLYWTVELDNTSNIVTNAWVEVPTSSSTTDLNSIDTGNSPHNRISGSPNGDGITDGTFKVEIGTVTEGAPIQQKLSSDVFWSTVVMTRSAS